MNISDFQLVRKPAREFTLHIKDGKLVAMDADLPMPSDGTYELIEKWHLEERLNRMEIRRAAEYERLAQSRRMHGIIQTGFIIFLTVIWIAIQVAK